MQGKEYVTVLSLWVVSAILWWKGWLEDEKGPGRKGSALSGRKDSW